MLSSQSSDINPKDMWPKMSITCFKTCFKGDWVKVPAELKSSKDRIIEALVAVIVFIYELRNR